MNHIFLIGFMGTGKSTVSRLVAHQLGWRHIELDEEIVRAAGLSIPALFEAQGEKAFRDLESACLRNTTSTGQGVVSCGGGAVLRKENVAHMKEKGVLVLLKSGAETIYNRIKENQNRPILNSRPTLEGIKELMEVRQKLYEKAAQVVVETDGKSPQEVCEEVLLKLKDFHKA